ncbi:MAG: hypothetical protein HC822_26845, partial [Oscillochloris sp.]|nr:hypothetical protein [Oscillochloris sp.]
AATAHWRDPWRRAAAGLIGHLPQAAIYALAGYSALADVALTLGAYDNDREMLRNGRKAVRALNRFALAFPIATPAALRWAGVLAQREGRVAIARRKWRRAAELARIRHMPYDEGWARMLLAGVSTGRERVELLDYADACFARVGATYERAQVAKLR